MPSDVRLVSTEVSRRTLLEASAALAGGGLLAAAAAERQPTAASDAPLVAYVGTFSARREGPRVPAELPQGHGRGIHLFRVDRATGAMTPLDVCELETSPSCLAIDATGTCLYSANETDRVGDGREGTVGAFAIGRPEGRLAHLGTVRSGGAGPTHISLHPSGRFLFVANYGGGSVAVLPIGADGALGAPSDIQHDLGPVGARQAGDAPPGSFAVSGHDDAHAHMIQADPSGRFVLHTDLGLDRLYVWKFDALRGILAPCDPPWAGLPSGDGPRHLAFHPNGRWCYSIQEEASTIVLFDYDGIKGALRARQTLSSLPPGYAGSSFASGILVSADGRFVYAGNRLHDSIAIFSVGANGELTFVADEWTRGDYPRSSCFDPTGRFLFCCNQRADHVTVFRTNLETGRLTFTGHYAPVGSPSHVVLVELA